MRKLLLLFLGACLTFSLVGFVEKGGKSVHMNEIKRKTIVVNKSAKVELQVPFEVKIFDYYYTDSITKRIGEKVRTIKANKDKQFLVMNVEVINNGNEEEIAPALDAIAIDDNGTKSKPEYDIESTVVIHNRFLPGEKRKGTLTYQVEKGQKIKILLKSKSQHFGESIELPLK